MNGKLRKPAAGGWGGAAAAFSRSALGLLPPLGVLLVWELGVRFDRLPGVFFPRPTEVGLALLELTRSGAVFRHLCVSLGRVFAGYAIGVALAVPLGLFMGSFSSLRTVFRPGFEMLRTVSPIAWIPLAVIWFGIGNAPGIFIIAITCFSPALVAAIDAVERVDPLYLTIARNFGASRGQQIWSVVIPASLPPIFVGLRIAMGIAWVVIVAAEMVGMRSGVGYLILDARNMIRTDIVIACMIVIGLAGFLLDLVMRRLERCFAAAVAGSSR